MGFESQDLLDANEAFLTKIGYLAMVTCLNGPFGRRNFASVINGFQTREEVTDVVAGDYAYTGNEWGKVKSITEDDDPEFWEILVDFPQTTKPDGVENEDFNPLRQVKYRVSKEEATGRTGTSQGNAWQKLGNLGIIFVYPTAAGANNPFVTMPEFALENGVPVIHNLGAAISLDFNVAGVSVQKTVGGTPSGAPVIANGSGVASMPNGNTTGQVNRYK